MPRFSVRTLMAVIVVSTTHMLKAVQPHIMQATSEDELDLKQWRLKRDELESRLQKVSHG